MKLTKCISDGQWDALFDELDGDKSGALSLSEFWAKAAIKNSSILSDALNKFDVSTRLSWLTCRSKTDAKNTRFSRACFEQNAFVLRSLIACCNRFILFYQFRKLMLTTIAK